MASLLDEDAAQQQLTLEKAIESFLGYAQKEVQARNLDMAKDYLNKAKARLSRLTGAAQERWTNRAMTVETHIGILDLVVLDGKPFMRHFQLLSRELVSPRVFECMYGLVRLIRLKVFCRELNIPETIEFDGKDEAALFGMTFLGGAPCSLTRTWIHHGTGDTKWAVLDRICTVKDTRLDEVQEEEVYNYRKQGLAMLTFSHGVKVLAQDIGPRVGIHVLVVHIPARSHGMVKRLLARGFRLVLTEKEIVESERGPEGRIPIVFLDNDRIRINSIHLWIALPNADEAAVQRDLDEITRVAREQLRISVDPVAHGRAHEMFARAAEEARRRSMVTPHAHSGKSAS